MTKKDYELIAGVLEQMREGPEKRALVAKFTTALAGAGSRFDQARFAAACTAQDVESQDAYDLVGYLKRQQVAPMGSAEGKLDPQCSAKLFHPVGRFTFYVLEWDGDDTLFGWVLSPLDPSFDELTYGSVQEMVDTPPIMGNRFEADLYFTAQPISQLVPQCAELYRSVADRSEA